MSETGEQSPESPEPPSVTRSGANWSAPAATGSERRRHTVTLLAGLGTMVALGGAAWMGSGAYLEGEARQAVANAWEQARTCLVGDGLRATDAPSERLRRIDLAIRHRELDDPWPARCEPYTRQLDGLLSRRTMRRALGELPALTPLTSAEDPLDHGEALDRVYEELETANLPRAERLAAVPPAPAPARPKLNRGSLAPLGRVSSLASIDVSLDVDTGTSLRLLLPEQRPLVCRFNDGPLTKRWHSVKCQAAPLTAGEDAKVKLAEGEKSAPDLIQIRDGASKNGFYDATTGQRLLHPRYFDAQALVHRDGRTHLLYADLEGEDSSERVKRFRLMTMEPGRRPKRDTLKIARRARVRLLGDRLLWWLRERPSEGERFAPRDALWSAAIQPLTQKRRLGKPVRVGELALGSRPLAQCTSRGTRVTAFVSGLKERRYALVFQRGDSLEAPLDVGRIEGPLTMTCDGGEAVLQRRRGAVVSTWRCDPERCRAEQAGPLPDAELSEVATIGDRLALVWAPEGEALRLRVAPSDSLHASHDVVVLEDELHGGIEPVAARWVTGSHLGVLLLQDVGRRIYAIRVTAGGKLDPVRVAR